MSSQSLQCIFMAALATLALNRNMHEKAVSVYAELYLDVEWTGEDEDLDDRSEARLQCALDASSAMESALVSL